MKKVLLILTVSFGILSFACGIIFVCSVVTACADKTIKSKKALDTKIKKYVLRKLGYDAVLDSDI